MRLAWFSPLPPSTSGIAAYSAELLPFLRARGMAVDTFEERNAHDFVWKARRTPYDLTVFHMGNAACHDYMWAYLFRYPGLVVLHDAQLHQARALALTKRWIPRTDDYRAEFHANHPAAPPEIADLVAAGLGEGLFRFWPHIRLVIESAKLTVVHNRRLLAELQHEYPHASLTSIAMGVGDPRHAATGADREPQTPADVRAGLALAPDAILIAAFGGITPEKRIDALLRALEQTASRHPHVHLLLVGRQVEHYDVMAEATRYGVAERVHCTGYVPDESLGAYMRAADICACLRWPTNRETSASWLRCLAAGRPTLVTGLEDLVDVPMIDPRGWRRLDVAHPARDGVAVSIDLVDEERSLELALERLVVDLSLRTRLGAAAREWWASHHQLAPMAAAYEAVIARASQQSAPRVALPPHLTADGSGHLAALVHELGVHDPLADAR